MAQLGLLAWLVAGASCVVAEVHSSAEPAPLRVKTPSGVVIGQYTQSTNGGGIRQFLGIPYAAPPIGSRRWKPLSPHTWEVDLVANKSGPACPQLFDGNEPIFNGEIDEDCLYINVITPKYPIKANLPVYAYIYGGSFMNGDTGMYSEGGMLATIPSQNQDIIAVVFNYRVGPLGYLSLAELAGEDPRFASSGNYGQQDQRAAIQWLQKHIYSFGGDPTQITIGGESAGAISIMGHLTSLQTPHGLIKGTYIESGTPSGGQFSTQSDGLANGANFKSCAFKFVASQYYSGPPLNASQCSTSASPASQLECLRSIPWIDLMYMTDLVTKNDTDVKQLFKGCSFAWTPTIDKYEWDDTPAAMAAKGKNVKNVTVLLGNVKNEGTLFTLALLLQKKVPGALEIDALLATVWSLLGHGIKPGEGIEAYKLYHPSQYKAHFGNLSTWAALSALGGDGMLFCPSRQFARNLIAHGTPVYMYEFLRKPRCWTPSYPPITDNVDKLGVFHESDVPYTFNMSTVNGRQAFQCNASTPYDPRQSFQCGPAVPNDINASQVCHTEPPIAHTVFNYLTNMVRHSNPNFDGGPQWPLFNTNEDRIGINLTTHVLPGPFASKYCDFWDKIDVTALYKLLKKFL